MLRYLTPALLVAATAWVHHHNGLDPTRQLVLPGIEVIFPETAGDLPAMGARSVQGLAVLAALSLVWTAWEHVGELRRRRQLARLRSEDGD